MVQLSHPYLTTGKTIALTVDIFVSKVMSRLYNTLSRFVIALLLKSKHLLCLAAQLCPTLRNPMDRGAWRATVHGDSPGKKTGVDFHALLQGIFPAQGSNHCLLHCRQILYSLCHLHSNSRVTSHWPCDLRHTKFFRSLSCWCSVNGSQVLAINAFLGSEKRYLGT